MVKKTLYVTTYKVDENGDGISSKILAQIRSIKNMGYLVDCVYLSEEGILFNTDGEVKLIKIKKIFRYFFFLYVVRFFRDKKFHYDYIYVRNPHGGLYSIFFHIFLKKMKKNDALCILEIPHYPYEKETRSFLGRGALIAHKISRIFFLKYIDKIAYMGEEISKIWGVSTTRINNGIEPDRYPSVQNKLDTRTIKMIGVASLAYWHGYDRLINSIADYYKRYNDINIEFHVVGDGKPEYISLKKLVHELSLEKSVIFHGRKNGKELDDLFFSMNIGVDSLGRHRSGNNYNDSIKSKEYAIRNLPFIKSHIDDSFQGVDFVFNVSADETVFDLNDIIEWYNNLNLSNENVRAYAINNLTIVKQMEKLFT
ncbi:glycosyltransferase [Pectobacterium carotovorum]|uniref:glycosyltransferase n=1 Tax=Pectobacterium carotovorum TaxID=554 RepID=UPI00208ABFBC|nr:glycosyltransferase [Pectobacterium carotovorum]GKW39307.1 glycoside hydrolase [Pectobacterium carotovorum subsp. carotovorum]